MKRQARNLIVSSFCLAAISPLRASTIAEWNFDDPANTPLKSAMNAGTGGGAWTFNFDATATDGSGKLVSKKPSGGVWNTYWAMPSSAPRKLWLVVDLAGWNMSGEKIKEAVRAGFSSSADDNKPQVVAQAVLERLPNGGVAARGDALGDGATEISGDASSLHQSSTSPVTLILGLDRDAGTYSLSVRSAEGGLKDLGSGKTSPGREPKYVRFSIAGDLSGNEENVSVDRIVVTDSDPSAS